MRFTAAQPRRCSAGAANRRRRSAHGVRCSKPSQAQRAPSAASAGCPAQSDSKPGYAAVPLRDPRRLASAAAMPIHAAMPAMLQSLRSRVATDSLWRSRQRGRARGALAARADADRCTSRVGILQTHNRKRFTAARIIPEANPIVSSSESDGCDDRASLNPRLRRCPVTVTLEVRPSNDLSRITRYLDTVNRICLI
jgi:hypothetical protein